MKASFYEQLNKIIRAKRHDDKFFLSFYEYNEATKIRILKPNLNTPGLQKSVKDYRNVTRYVWIFTGKERVIKSINDNSTVIYFATNEDV